MAKSMYRKYHEVWSVHATIYGPRTALLYQVGGFFEIYDTENLTTGTTQSNIREVAELCQLSLSQHVLEDNTQTLFGGFPVDALPKFEKILVQAGWTVVVVVQRKGKSGAVEERIVDHISSPGCFTDGSVKERRLVGCIVESGGGPTALQRVYWAAVALDLATGRIWFTEGSSVDRLHQFLCVHPPAELVLWSDGLPAANRLTDSLKKVCNAVHMKCLAPASAAVDQSILGGFWKPAQIAAWLHKYPHSRRALAALLAFANDHVPSAMKCLDEPEHWIPDGEVRLGNAALEQLGILNLRSAEEGLLGLMDQCRSVAGRRLLRSRLLRPITDITELEGRLDRIEAAAKRDPVVTERGLRSLYDMSRLWRRLELGSANMNDMACLLRSYEAAATLGAVSDLFAWIFARWDLASTTLAAREESAVPLIQLPFVVGNYPAAEILFAEGLAIRGEAEALCTSWSQKQGKEQLYLDNAEGGGFRITGTKRRIQAAYTMLRDGGDSSAEIIQYKSTASLESATLTDISERHKKWLRKWTPVWSETWSRSMTELVTFGRNLSAEVEAWCADLDVSWTVSAIAAEWRWTRPIFVTEAEGGYIDVVGLRHPILERLVKVPYVPHSVTLGSSLLLYGMNASGKSSLMKALGLCTVMAQAGFPVPAASFRLAPFTAIFTRILGNDNIWAGLSSFAVEMTEFREILQFADDRSLVLGDELCSGTESLSATALVAAGIETLASRGTKFVFATHLHELATLIPPSVIAMHLKVHYDAATDLLIYDRTLAPGSGSALYGLEVCRALDLPPEYLDRATVIRKQLAGWVAPHRSVYSADAVIDRCAVCNGTVGLEAHHIQPQASASTTNLDVTGNLVCLCATCHDDHHGGRLSIQGWKETSDGRALQWSRSSVVTLDEHVRTWICEQRQLKVRIPTIQRMARQIFGVELTTVQIKNHRQLP